MIGPIVSAPYFMVDEIEVRWPAEMKYAPQHYRLRPSTSIFYLNLSQVSKALQQRHPGVEVEAVRRILPNHIVAQLRPLKVAFQVRSDRYYPVSEDGIVVGRGQSAPWPNLPIIVADGLHSSFRVGESIRHPYFWQAVELFVIVRHQGGIGGHAVTQLRSRADDLILFLETGQEIRFAGHRIWAGWQQLAELLTQKPELLNQVRYIDLRYNDPIVGPPFSRKK